MKIFIFGKVFFSECSNFSQNSVRKVDCIFFHDTGKKIELLDLVYVNIYHRMCKCVRVKNNNKNH